MHHVTPIVTLAAHPLIDIDLTVLLQFGLFLVMAFIANRMLFQPYLALRERRKDGIDGARVEASRMTATAEAKLAEYEKKLATRRAEAGDEARKVRLEAAAHEREVTDKARAAAQSAIDSATEKMRTETAAARAELMPQAEALAASIASKLLGREVA